MRYIHSGPSFDWSGSGNKVRDVSFINPTPSLKPKFFAGVDYVLRVERVVGPGCSTRNTYLGAECVVHRTCLRELCSACNTMLWA